MMERSLSSFRPAPKLFDFENRPDYRDRKTFIEDIPGIAIMGYRENLKISHKSIQVECLDQEMANKDLMGQRAIVTTNKAIQTESGKALLQKIEPESKDQNKKAKNSKKWKVRN